MINYIQKYSYVGVAALIVNKIEWGTTTSTEMIECYVADALDALL